jgi:TolA-binding protein
MKKASCNYSLLLFSTLLIALLSACSNENQNKEKPATEPPREQYLQEIKRIETSMHTSMTLNKDTAESAIRAYLQYVVFFPKDSIAPDYLFKAAEIATASSKYEQALTIYKNITDNYPNYKLLVESLYLQAFIYDNHLNDDAKAKIIYESLIQKYPSSAYVNDAKAAIANLGKTDEQLIEEFKKKNGVK